MLSRAISWKLGCTQWEYSTNLTRPVLCLLLLLIKKNQQKKINNNNNAVIFNAQKDILVIMQVQQLKLNLKKKVFVPGVLVAKNPLRSRCSLLCGARNILSALRCRGKTIHLSSAMPEQGHPSPLCGVGTRSSHSALRGRGNPISLHSAILSALWCRNEVIPLRSAVSGPDHPTPLCEAGAIPSLSTRRCRGDPLRSAVPGRSHPSPLGGAGAILSALWCRNEVIPLRSAVSGPDHRTPLCDAGAIPSLSTRRCRGHPLRSVVPE